MKRYALPVLSCLLLLSLAVSAQVCPPGEILLKNDNLPDVPMGASQVGVFPGICDSQPVTVGILEGCFPGGTITPSNGEAMVCVLDISQYQFVDINSVAVFAAGFNPAGGQSFVVNVEIYDDVLPAGAGFVFGQQIFDLGVVSGTNAQVTTNALNLIDISAFNVRAFGPRVVLAVRMVLNMNGQCVMNAFGGGGTSAGFACDLIAPTPAGTQFIDGFDICTGTALPTLADMVTIPPQFFLGRWIARMCAAPGPLVNPLQVTFLPSANAVAGSPTLVQLVATPAEANLLYIPVFSCTPGTTPLGGTPFTLPLALDTCSPLLYDPALASIISLTPGNSVLGQLNASGQASGFVNIPLGVTTQFQLYFAYGVLGAGGQLQGVSNLGVLNVN